MKKIFFCLGLILLCGCGSSTDEAAFRNDIMKDVFKLATVSVACSMLDNSNASDACLEGALENEGADKTGSTKRSKRNYSRTGSVSGGRSCFSNMNCGIGFTCIKKSYEPTGICMKKVDQYGIEDPTIDDGTPKQCNYPSDCPIGFKCDPDHKICIKD